MVEARRRAMQARRLVRKQRALAQGQVKAAQQQGAVQLGVQGVQVQGVPPAGGVRGVDKVRRGSGMQRKQQLQPQVQGEEERIPAVAVAAAGK